MLGSVIGNNEPVIGTSSPFLPCGWKNCENIMFLRWERSHWNYWCYWEMCIVVAAQVHHPPIWCCRRLFTATEKNPQSEVADCLPLDGQPCTLMTSPHSILISKWRCIRRFWWGQSHSFSCSAGEPAPFASYRHSGDNHIGDLSRAWLCFCLSRSITASCEGISTFTTSTETERGGGEVGDGRGSI